MREVRVDLLGPLALAVDGRPTAVPGVRLARLLLRLAVDAGRPVGTGELCAAVWADDVPADPANALQSLASRLRRLVGPDAVRQADPGYALAVPRDAVDLHRWAPLVKAGRAAAARGEGAAALEQLDAALALDRGEPLAEAGDAPYAEAERVRHAEERLAALLDRAAALVTLGRASEAVPGLTELVAAAPLREPVTLQLMRALAASGRTAEALAAYEQLRATLADTLGTDPSPALQAEHLALLRGPAGEPEAARTNLRSPLTSFLGREEELARISAVVAGSRVTTVVGPGGAGKTRLAAEVARRLVPRFSDGAWLVELAAVEDPDALPQAVLNALGSGVVGVLERRAERAPTDPAERLLTLLAGSRCLLVVDNCEHLVAAVARLVDRIATSCPDVTVLATSREPLAILGEVVCGLPPLEVPDAAPDLEAAAANPAVRLLLERARAVAPGFRLTPATLAAVVEIVRRLDGLPLAIELAAARLRVLPVRTVADRLGDRFRLLSGGNRAALPRHQTLWAVVAWSWDLLSPAERRVAERLAVFPGGADVEAAAAVCAEDGEDETAVADLLAALADKSLVQPVPDGDGVRYRMLETLREFGTRRLADTGRLAAARAAHARYYARLADTLDPDLRSPRQLAAVARFTAERENLLAALRFLADRGDGRAATDLAIALSWYWTLIGAAAEQLAWTRLALATPGSEDHPDRPYLEASVVLSLVFLDGTGDAVGGPDGLEPVDWSTLGTSLAVHRARLASAPPPSRSHLRILRPVVEMLDGHAREAVALVEPMIAEADEWGAATLRAARANFAENYGDLDQVARDVDAAHATFERLGDRWGLASVLASRSGVRMLTGDLAGAVADVEQALACGAERGSREDVDFLTVRLADLRHRLGDLPGAHALLEQLAAEDEGPRMPERELLVTSTRLGFAVREDDRETAARLVVELRRDLAARRPVTPLFGHLRGVLLASLADAELAAGHRATAEQDLREAYPMARATHDLPIVSLVGVVVAAWTADLRESVLAARMLGACARLRGGEDPTHPLVAATTARLRGELGCDAFAAAYAAGRALDPEKATALLDPVTVPVPAR